MWGPNLEVSSRGEVISCIGDCSLWGVRRNLDALRILLEDVGGYEEGEERLCEPLEALEWKVEGK